ncbi:hypothetical protein IFM89_021372 [Coptis chinensis]|uniref:Uncharacterized protein n=1 Tax=Coptis chinensis TaxID=261450 RepID=A0A835IE14_9MAGN|nr:hypothetical protein IFM89_021372 [Coptis chinensis]
MTVFGTLISPNITNKTTKPDEIGKQNKSVGACDCQNQMKEQKGDGQEEETMAVWDCGSPLYDAFELASLGHLIDRHLMILPNSVKGSKRWSCNRVSDVTDSISPSTLRSRQAVFATKSKGSSKRGLLREFVGEDVWKGGYREGKKKQAKSIKIGFHLLCSGCKFWKK